MSKSNSINSTLVSTIVRYSERYRNEMLGKFKPETLLTDWWAALDFFFGRACFQGRRDKISERVYNAVISVLEPVFSKDKNTKAYLNEQANGWERIKQELSKHIGKGKVGKARDVEMVISSLQFISRLPNLNFVGYTVDKIHAGQINAHYEEIQRLKSTNGIVQVGPKIASFYLRDVVSIFKLESKIPIEFSFQLQPIDVWVRKLAHKTGIAPYEAKDADIQNAIVTLCKTYGVSPLQFNQGAWYVGYFSFDLLLEKLTNSEVKLRVAEIGT